MSQPGGEWTKGYRLGYYVQIREVLYKNFEQILNGQETVDQGFDAIEKDSNELLVRFKDTYN